MSRKNHPENKMLETIPADVTGIGYLLGSNRIQGHTTHDLVPYLHCTLFTTPALDIQTLITNQSLKEHAHGHNGTGH